MGPKTKPKTKPKIGDRNMYKVTGWAGRRWAIATDTGSIGLPADAMINGDDRRADRAVLRVQGYIPQMNTPRQHMALACCRPPDGHSSLFCSASSAVGAIEAIDIHGAPVQNSPRRAPRHVHTNVHKHVYAASVVCTHCQCDRIVLRARRTCD
eukprot:SAG31_NODE_2364_length_5860_cov_11.314529_5_plen_153_part_00